jgi:hypothetical protein
MLTLKTSAHIRTRNIKSFRSCQSSTGPSTRHAEAAQLYREGIRLANRELRRLWLEEQWSGHFEQAAGPFRVLPPSARFRSTTAR